MESNILLIQSIFDDYRLAFHLNKQLNLKLTREKSSLLIKSKSQTNSLLKFTYNDIKNDLYWILIKNKIQLTPLITKESSILRNSIPRVKCLLKTYKQFDYILKINQNTIEIAKTIKKIRTVNGINFVCQLNHQTSINKINTLI